MYAAIIIMYAAIIVMYAAIIIMYAAIIVMYAAIIVMYAAPRGKYVLLALKAGITIKTTGIWGNKVSRQFAICSRQNVIDY